MSPSETPSGAPSVIPTEYPTGFPSYFPSGAVSVIPTDYPTDSPSYFPTSPPTTFTPTSSCKNYLFTLSIVTDEKPDENTWKLEDDQGSIVFSGGPYTSPNTLYTARKCLDDTSGLSTLAKRRSRKKTSKKNKKSSKDKISYTFTIYDSGRNGLCCKHGDGSYVIRINNELITESGATNKFKFKQRSTFTLAQAPVPSYSPSLAPTLSPVGSFFTLFPTTLPSLPPATSLPTKKPLTKEEECTPKGSKRCKKLVKKN